MNPIPPEEDFLPANSNLCQNCGFAAWRHAKSNNPCKNFAPAPSSREGELDARDLETRLRQDLGLLEYEIRDLLEIVDPWHTQQVEAAVATARIEEIEDISQSRHVVVEDDGTIWCEHCHTTLEDAGQDCACEIIYKKRAARLKTLKEKP